MRSDGDEFSFDPAVAAADQRDAGQDLRAGAADAEGRRDPPRPAASIAAGRREFTAAVEDDAAHRVARCRAGARSMTTTEQIVWAHRVDKDCRRSTPGATLTRLRRSAAGVGRHRAVLDPHLQPDHRRQHDLSAPGGDRQRSLRLHRQGRRQQADGIGREFARAARHREAVLRDAGRRHLPFLFSRAGAGDAGPVHSGRRLAQPRLRRLRRGRAWASDRRRSASAGRPATSTSPSRRRDAWCSTGSCSRGSAARTSCSSCCAAGAAKQSQGMSVELVDANRQLPIAYRNTIANMMAEAEALNGIFAPDEITVRLVSRQGDHRAAVSARSRRAPTRVYAIDETIDLTDVMPMIAKPFSPGNAFPAEEVARERLTFDKAMIGSCTNGSYDDLLAAALVRARRARAGRDQDGEGVRGLSGIRRRRAADRAARCAARRRIDRRGVPIGRRTDPPVVVRPVLRPGAGRARARAARHHLVQSQLAEPHGPRRRRLSRQPRRRRRVGAARLHGAAERAGPDWNPEEFGV